jgi:hypothetical protein
MICGEKPTLGRSIPGILASPEGVNVIGLPSRLPEKVPVAATVCAGTGREK